MYKCAMLNPRHSGFTLIELMITVAILGILAAIAIPQFANSVEKAHQGATKGNLGTIRSAISIYYADNEGIYPTDALGSLLASGRYMLLIPPVNFANHGISASIGTVTTDDSGGWTYGNDPSIISSQQTSGPTLTVVWGGIVVNCNHTDLKGNIWFTN